MSDSRAGAGRLTQEIGVAGLKVYSGYVQEEYLRELQGARGMRVYADMRDNDATVGALLYAIDLLCRRVKWHVEAPDASSEAEEQAEFLETCLHDMSAAWEDVVSEALSMLVFGWSFAEIVLKRRGGPDEKDPTKRSRYTDGRIGIRKLAPRAQETLVRWEMQEDGGIAGWWQQPPTGGGQVFLPIERGLLFRTQARKNNPEGRSILRNAYRPWFILRTLENVEAVGMERELAGLPVVSIPARYLTSDEAADVIVRQAYETIAKQLKFNEQGGLVIPSDTFPDAGGNPTSIPMVKVELLSSGGQRSMDVDKAIRRHQGNIARSVLADFLMLGQGDKGSFALSANKTDLFLGACQTFLDQIATVFNRHLTPRLWRANGLSGDTYPKVVPGQVKPTDMTALADYLHKLAAAGATLWPDEDLDRYVREAGGLPPPKDEDLDARREAAEAATQAFGQGAQEAPQEEAQEGAQDEDESDKGGDAGEEG